jgi:hypothetical protein
MVKLRVSTVWVWKFSEIGNLVTVKIQGSGSWVCLVKIKECSVHR